MTGLSFEPPRETNTGKTDRNDVSDTSSYDSNYTLTNNALTVINDNIFDLIRLINKTPNEPAKQINSINKWKNTLVEEQNLCKFTFKAYCSKNKDIKDANAEDILKYTKKYYAQIMKENRGGKRKSLRSHKKSKKRKQTKHMRKGKNGKKSKTQKVKRSRH